MNGIEMGQATHNLDKAEEVLRKYRFDFVLGSLHAIRGMDDFAYVDFSGSTPRSSSSGTLTSCWSCASGAALTRWRT